MQIVSPAFENIIKGDIKSPRPGCLISWPKNISEDVKFFTLDHSYLDGPDKLKGSGSTITFADKYDYIDETAYVKNFRVTKKISNRPWGVIMASAEVELNNTTKRFMPGFDPVIGAYTELPDRPIKLSVGFNGEFIKLFTGYAKRPEHQLVKRVTKITAFDAMTYLSTVKSNLGAFVNTPMHEIIEALLIEQGFAYDQFNIEPSLQQPIGYYMPKDKYITDIFKEFCEAEAYLMQADEDGIIQGWNRLHFLGDRDPVWDFTYSNMEDLNWSSAPIINAAEVTAKPFKPAAWNKLYEADNSPDDRIIPPNSSADIFARFQDDLGDFPAISVQTPVYISNSDGGSSYSTNMSPDGDADTGAAHISLTSVYNFGSAYRMTFQNTSNVPIYITRIQLWGQPAKVTAIKGDVQEIPASILKYGLNPDNNNEVYKIENDVVQDLISANAMAWILVNTSANPRARLDIDNFVVPHMQIGDPVNVHILDTNETKYCNVLGYEIFFGVNANLTHKIYAEEREQHTYFRLDHSHLDGPDGLAL